MNIDTLVESFYSKKDETESLINEVLSLLITEQEQDPEEDRVIRRPTIKITELWGKPQNGDREVMEALMRNIKGATVAEKIKSVNNFMEAQAPAEGEGDITEIMTYLIFLDTFASIIGEYGASVAGFLFEAFLAAIFGGPSMQVDDPAQVGATPGSLPIEDVQLAIRAGEEATDIRPYSLKVLTKGGIVKGSFRNTVDYFLDPAEERRTDNIVYLIVIKDVDKGGKGWNGNLSFYEFTISRENFLDMIGAPTEVPIFDYVPFEVPSNRLKQKIMKSPVSIKGQPVYRNMDGTPIKDGEKLQKGQQIMRLDQVGTKEVIKGSAAKLYKPEQYKKVRAAFEGAPSIDRQVFEIMKDTSGYKSEQQWKISPKVYEQNPIGSINLNPEVLRAKAEEYTQSLNDSVVKIFNAVGDLADNINRYFIGAKDENRKAAGLEAREDAQVLKVEVDKTITVK